MNDITSKTSSLRQAEAMGAVFCPPEVLEIVKQNKLPKGEPFGIALASGLLASKQTHHLIPHCHPVIIDGLQMKFYFSDDDFVKELTDEPRTGIYIWAKGKSVGHTGIEMELLTAISVSALVLYDLMKPLGQKNIEIGSVRLLEKKGGKSDKPRYPERLRKAVILSCPNQEFGGKNLDKTEGIIEDILGKKDIQIIDKNTVENVPQLLLEIEQNVRNEVPLIITLGKTSTPNLSAVLEKSFDKKLTGVIHAMYQHGFERSPLSVHSTLTAGVKNKSIIITLPSSSNGAKECLEAIISTIFHPLLKQK